MTSQNGILIKQAELRDAALLYRQYRTIIVRQVRASATLMQSIFFVRLAK